MSEGCRVLSLDGVSDRMMMGADWCLKLFCFFLLRSEELID